MTRPVCDLTKALEMAMVQFQALKINNVCIGLDKAHVDFNCTKCLASHGERCIQRALDKAEVAQHVGEEK